MIRYLAETQRIMAENMIRLTEIQQGQQQQLQTQQQQISDLSGRQLETDERFNVLLDEVRFLIRRLDNPQ